MDKSFFTDSDHFVSPYLRRRLRPLSEVLSGNERPGLRAVHVKADMTQRRGAAGPAVASSPLDNERDGQNRAD